MIVTIDDEITKIRWNITKIGEGTISRAQNPPHLC